MLSLISPPLVVYKAKSLLFNSLSCPISLYQPSTLASIISLYNDYKDDAMMTLISSTFKLNLVKNSLDFYDSFTDFNDYLDSVYDIETLQKCMLVCKSLIQQQRANNMVKFLKEKFNMSNNGQKSFIISLNNLFWRIVNRSPLNNTAMNSIGHPELTNLTSKL